MMNGVFFTPFWAPRLASSPSGFPLIVRGRKAVGSIVAVRSSSVALPLLLPIGLRSCGLSATIPGAKQFPSGLQEEYYIDITCSVINTPHRGNTAINWMVITEISGICRKLGKPNDFVGLTK